MGAWVRVLSRNIPAVGWLASARREDTEPTDVPVGAVEVSGENPQENLMSAVCASGAVTSFVWRPPSSEYWTLPLGW